MVFEALFTSKKPLIVAPLRSPRRESTGAVTLNWSKFDAFRLRLSVMVKLPNRRRKYETSTDTRGMICRCTPAENSQLYPRLFQPDFKEPSVTALGVRLPKLTAAPV